MATHQAYLDRVEALDLEELDRHIEAIQSIEGAKATKAQLTATQKQLRYIKQELNAEIKAIRARYQAELSTAGATGGSVMGMLGAFGVKGMRGAGKSHQADAKRRLREKQNRELDPYNRVKLLIDGILAEIDKEKAKIDSYIFDQRNNL